MNDWRATLDAAMADDPDVEWLYWHRSDKAIDVGHIVAMANGPRDYVVAKVLPDGEGWLVGLDTAILYATDINGRRI